MNKPDRFTLVTGIIGLFVDVISVFVIWDEYRAPNKIGKPLSGLLSLLILFLYVYGWFTLSWVFAKNKLQKKDIPDVSEDLLSFLVGSGIFLIPITGLWLYLLIGSAVTSITFLNILLATILAIALKLIVGVGILISVLALLSVLDGK